MLPNVIDMYHGDNRERVVDFAALATYGIWGVIHKATQGLKYTDPKFQDRILAAFDTGMLVAAYHYMDASDAVSQADHFLTTAGAVFAQRRNTNILLAVDYEKSADGNHPALHQLQDFVAYIDKHAAGTSCVVYGSDLIRETLKPIAPGHISSDMIGVLDFFRRHRLWLAEYGPHENIPFPWKGDGETVIQPWLWQYKSVGHLPAVIGETDLNYYAGTREQLTEEWRAGPTPATSLLSPETIAANRAYMGA